MNVLDKEDNVRTFNPSRLRASSFCVQQSHSAPSLWAHGAPIQHRPVGNVFGLLNIRDFRFESSAFLPQLIKQDQSLSGLSTIRKHILYRDSGLGMVHAALMGRTHTRA